MTSQPALALHAVPSASVASTVGDLKDAMVKATEPIAHHVLDLRP